MINRVQHLRSLNSQLSLKAGLQFDNRNIESNDRGNHKNIHTGVYTMMHYFNQSGLNATLGLRLDYDDNYEVEFSPQLNVSYNIQIKATVFSRQSSSLIDFVETNQTEIGDVGDLQLGEDYFFAKNISNVTTSGFETEVYYNKTWGDKNKFKWGLGYTYLNTTNEEDVISVYISSHAKHLLTSNLHLQLNRFYVNLNSLFKDRPERIATALNTALSQSYFLHNTKVGMHITDNIGAYVQVHNLGDIEYQNILGARMPGRWFKAGVHWNL